jgi:hypothetical protein
MNAAFGSLNLLLAFSLMLGGGASVSGVPLPADAALRSAVPAECLLYVEHRGYGPADPASKNHVEQLLAEPEVQAFVDELMRLAEAGIKRLPADDQPSRLVASTAPLLTRTLVERPSLLYLSTATLPPNKPGANAALVVHVGKQIEAVREALDEWEQFYLSQIPPNHAIEKSTVDGTELRRLPLPPEAPPLVWGVHGEFLFLALGEGEGEAVVKRLAAAGPVPAWLTDVEQEVGIPRLGCLAYFNLAKTMALVEPLLNLIPGGDLPISPKQIVEQLGLKQLRYLAVAGGLDETSAMQKLVLAHEAGASGIAEWLAGKPLQKGDLAGIPAVADFAWTGRLDAATIYDRVLALVERFDADGAREFAKNLARAEGDVGFRVREELLAGLGDVWALYNSPTEGGSLLTGLCASVSVRDRAKIDKVIEQALRLALAEATKETGNRRTPPFAVRRTTVGKHTVHYLQVFEVPWPVAPAWCLTDDRLIVASSPQMVRAHLTRAADAPLLAERADIVAQLAPANATGLSYLDPKLGAQVLYSYLQYGATMGAAIIEKETGLRTDVAKFPSFATLAPHILPNIGVTRSTKTAWSIETHGVAPSIGPVVVGVAAAAMLTGVQQARAAARSVGSTNQLRQLTLAALLYADRHRKPVPRAIRSADGKPLLSWRVALLPDLEQQGLYERFHLDEPWDSPHNQTLLPLMPDAFRHPTQAAGESTTQYQLPRGKGTLYEDRDDLTESEVDRLPVGRSQTVLFVEAAADRAVPWTKPDDVELTPETLFDRLFRNPDDTIRGAMHDGSVLNFSAVDDRETTTVLFFPRTAR